MPKTTKQESAASAGITISKPAHKDSLFRAIYRDEKRAKELCAATTGIVFSDNAQVKLCNLENTIAQRFNDIGVAIDGNLLFMCEHQSSINPNMPLRLLEYVFQVLFLWFVDRKMLYGEELVKIPLPQFYVLYNGKSKLAFDTLRLSDAFLLKGERTDLDLVVHVIDINYESKGEILEKCDSLNGYAYLIAKIREFKDNGASQDKAIANAVRICINEGILTDFLSKENYREVCDMLFYEYSLEDELAVRGEQRERKGHQKGLLEAAKKLLCSGMSFEETTSLLGLTDDLVMLLKKAQNEK